MSAVNAIDTSNWTNASVGYEEFKIPPEYKNPYSSDFHMYEYDYDINVFTVRYVNPAIMSLYGYFMEHNKIVKKVEVAGHDAVFFSGYDMSSQMNTSKLWFSAGDEFYYIAWNGSEITPTIEEVVKSASPSNYNTSEFYSLLNDEYSIYKITDAIESQRYDSPAGDKGSHSFVSVGTNGVNFGIMS
ncbi:hypothetical protein [Methanobrevibacter sp.]|uniref:hypothetical protein n=1 Tax=Methanobrevibacter sp. TaxID=66852 RepID=UPI00388E0783